MYVRISSTCGTTPHHSATQGMNVYVHGKMATVRYIGSTEFADGTWLGVEFRTPDGRHDGTVKGRTYFTWSVLVCVRPYSSGQWGYWGESGSGASLCFLPLTLLAHTEDLMQPLSGIAVFLVMCCVYRNTLHANMWFSYTRQFLRTLSYTPSPSLYSPPSSKPAHGLLIKPSKATFRGLSCSQLIKNWLLYFCASASYT